MSFKLLFYSIQKGMQAMPQLLSSIHSVSCIYNGIEYILDMIYWCWKGMLFLEYFEVNSDM